MKEAVSLTHFDGRKLLHLWMAALLHPSQAFEELKRSPAPTLGLYATLLNVPFALLLLRG